jgi:integrase
VLSSAAVIRKKESAMSLAISPKRPRRTREWLRESVLAEVAEGFERYLRDHGYMPSMIGIHLGGVAHFAYWLTRTGRGIGDINEALVGRFLEHHLRGCRCVQPCVQQRPELHHALTTLLQWLQQEQLVASVVARRSCLEEELSQFERYLRGVCGQTATTRYSCMRIVRHFLSSQFAEQPLKLTRVTPEQVRSFIEQHAWQPISLRSVGVALRSYFRFKALGGAVVEPLVAAIPQVPRWRLASLPKTFTPSEIERLLGAIDRTRPKGLRDYAMARCLIDLGLRPIELTRLRLEDVDWRAGTLAIRGKGRRVDRLPLPKPLGAALAQYLRHARPRHATRALFVRWRAPRGELTSKAIYAALRSAAERCGLSNQFTGLRLFRHTLACRLIERGASLKAIADVLRHRSLDTTPIYAKADLAALKRVALPWPGRLT